MKTASQSSLVRSFALALAFAVNFSCLAQTPSPAATIANASLDEYRRFAMGNQGDVARGAKFFADEQKLACAKCHTVDGRGGKAGPDLYAIGDKFPRRELIDAILLPSATIAVGYVTTIIETKAGLEYTGIVQQANNAEVQLIGADGKLVRIAATDIKEKRGSPLSLMPEGLQASLSHQEFTDLIEYLATLKQPANALISHRGMPDVIPELARPVTVRPFFTELLRVPPGKVQTGLTFMAQVPGQANVFLVLHQTGKVWLMEKTSTGEEKSSFLDLTGEVFYERGPNGLLGLAFHPKFRENRKYYLKYQVFEEGTVTTTLVERQFAPDFRHDSGLPARRLLKILSVAEDHGGGCIQFGPDGFLYLGMGDTGPHHDPNGHGQNLQLLIAKILRLDVDHAEDGKAYAIPRDNPFRGRSGARPEIWAYGLREPWRFSFDSLTGDLWVADVGQDRVEEVDIVRRGENYGWNVYEAFEPFSNRYRKERQNYTPPVFAYKRKYGNSITGGYVYRGDKKSSFYGVYIFGDYTSKRIFGLTQKNRVLKAVRQIGTAPQGLVSFATDEKGNLYVVGFEGMISKIDFAGASFDEPKKD